jgi:thiol-disulfide isomerase/thioredoxin
MARTGKYRGRRAPLAAFGIVMAIGLATGLTFERTELRGVTVTPPADTAPANAPLADTPLAGPSEQPAPAPEGEPASFSEAFAAGIAFLRLGDAHSAVQAFETARKANPHAPEVYANLGFAYLELNQPAASRTVFERASAIAPMQANVYFGLAEALDALGDTEGAMGAMRTYLHLAPGDDPFRRRAMSALWEWETRDAAAPAPAAGPDAPVLTANKAPAKAATPLFDAPLQTLDGAPANLAAYRGKFLVLNIWAVWCAPCRAELPSLDRLSQALDPGLFAVAGVSIDKERAFTREFLAELGVGFPSYWDSEKRLTQEIFFTPAIPLTLIVDPLGEILVGYEGARDWSAPAMVAVLNDLAGGEAPYELRVAKLLEVLQ